MRPARVKASRLASGGSSGLGAMTPDACGALTRDLARECTFGGASDAG